MNPAEALNVLTRAASERVQDARAAGHALTADLLALNLNEAKRVLDAALAPKKPDAPAPCSASPCG
jgi:hypothetical protein